MTFKKQKILMHLEKKGIVGGLVVLQSLLTPKN